MKNKILSLNNDDSSIANLTITITNAPSGYFDSYIIAPVFIMSLNST
jgi:hypothetical protein